MDTETPPMQDHDFVSSQWVDMGGYATTQHHQLTDFTGFQFGSSPIMPIEPAYSMSMPQPYTTQHLIPLTMSSQWPSMLSTQPGFAPMPVAPMPITPIPPPLQHVQAPQISTPPTPRRTLTDTERRRMCLYHQENPHVKQTEIGGEFFFLVILSLLTILFVIADELTGSQQPCLVSNEGMLAGFYVGVARQATIV